MRRRVRWSPKNGSSTIRGGERRVVVTKQLPGERWLELLVAAGCSVEVCTSPAVLTIEEISERIGSSCDGVIGQLTEGCRTTSAALSIDRSSCAGSATSCRSAATAKVAETVSQMRKTKFN